MHRLLLTFVFVLIGSTFVLQATAAASQTAGAPGIEGLWGVETRIGLPVQGELILEKRGDSWRASIAGIEAKVQVTGNDLRFALPGDVAEFRGRLDSAGKQIRGFWIQPSGAVFNQQYASPVELHPVEHSVWRGVVVPLEQRLSLYLQITTKDGKLSATLSNPEMNIFRRQVYSISQDGSSLSLESKGRKITGAYNSKFDTLSIQPVPWLPSFSLTRRSSDTAVGFYPRTRQNSSGWSYRAPIPANDGWAVSTLEAEGINPVPIRELLQRILAGNSDDLASHMQALLIARHGKLILEEYFYGFDRDRVHDMRSAAKTFAPVLVGLAQQQGFNLTPATPIYPLFEKYAPFANMDARKSRVTLRDIMSMTAGNACDDNSDESPGNEDRMQSDDSAHDWYKYSLDLPMLKEPGGTDAIYCSADLNLVGGAVASVTHAWLPAFFEQHLARPLQFGRYYLNLMPDGQAYMGGGAYLLARDQLKLGQLYLNGGAWNGKRILSKEWVHESTSMHSHFEEKFSLGQKHEYGYGWHIHALTGRGKTFHVFAAEGNGGQFVIVVPELEMVIGINGGSYGEFDKWYRWELELVPQYILSAALPDSSH